MREATILKAVHLAIGRVASVFRNNTGQAWTANNITRLPNGDIILHQPRPLHAGLTKGSSDLIGWRRVVVTPHMVGTPVAVFVAIEVKNDRGRATVEQQRFIDAVKLSGGLAGIARTPSEALAILGVHE